VLLPILLLHSTRHLGLMFLAPGAEASPYMGAAYWIPALWVPALLVTHYIVFVILFRRSSRAVQGH